MGNSIRVPVTTYHHVEITDEMLIEILAEEKKKLLPSDWECLVFYKDKVTLYKSGYGSHDIGEKEEDCHDEELIKKYKAIKETIEIIQARRDKEKIIQKR